MADDKAYRAQLQEESKRLFPGTGRKAKLRRKAWRNEQRAEQGYRAESKLSRGGIAGVWDRNKKVITPIATGLASLATGGLAAPILVGAAMKGLDREGKGGVGFDVGQGLRGAAEGAAVGGLAQTANAGFQAARAASAAGSSLPGAAWQGVKNVGAQLMPGGAAPVPVGGAPMTQAAQGGSWLDRAGSWLKDPQNLLTLGQGAYGAYANNQALAQERRALGEFDGPQLDRNALAERQFNRFAESTAPAYQASLRDANRYAAGTGRLNSGSLRMDFGNLANQRNLQLDAARGGYMDDALNRSMDDAQWRATNRAQGQRNVGDIYAQRAAQGMDVVNRLATQAGRRVTPTPVLRRDPPKPKKVAPIKMEG